MAQRLMKARLAVGRQESGAALLIITTIASMVMVGYSMYNSSDASMLLRRQQDHVATQLAQGMFSLVSSTITQSQTALCDADFEDFITVGDEEISPNPLELTWNEIQNCDELQPLFFDTQGRRQFPQHLVHAAEFTLALVSLQREEFKDLTARLEATMRVTVRSPGATDQGLRTTEHVTTFKIAVLRYANFGLMFHGGGPEIELDENTRLKVASPTWLALSDNFNLDTFIDAEGMDRIEFMQPVYSAEPLTNLTRTQEQFRATFQKGLITRFAPGLMQSPRDINNTDIWTIGEGGDTLYRCYHPVSSTEQTQGCEYLNLSSEASQDVDCSGYVAFRSSFGAESGKWSVPDFAVCTTEDLDSEAQLSLSGTSEDSPNENQSTSSYHLAFRNKVELLDNSNQFMYHNCSEEAEELDESQKGWHPYISLFENNPITISLSNMMLDEGVPQQYGPIFCGIIFAEELTIELAGEGDYIFFGIIAANELTIQSDNPDANLYLINPVALSSRAVRPRSVVSNQSVALSQYLKELNTTIGAIRTLQNVWGTSILRNIYLPLLQRQSPNWQNQLLSAQEFLYNDLSRERRDPTPNNTFTFQDPNQRDASQLYDAYDTVDSESTYANFGDPQYEPLYVVTMDDRQMKVCENERCEEES